MNIHKKIYSAFFKKQDISTYKKKHFLQSIFSSILLTIFLCTLTACANVNTSINPLTPKNKNELRVATYNVNWGEGVRPTKHPKKRIETLTQLKADMVLLQEMTPLWEKRIRKNKTLEKRYPYHRFYQYPRAGGLAALSKFPIKTQLYQHPQIGWHPIWIFTSQTPLGTIQFVNIHLNPPLVAEGSMGFLAHAVITSQGIRKREMRLIYKQLNHKLPTIIAGDFNESDFGRAVKFLQKNSFIDAFKQKNLRHHTWEWKAGPIHFQERFDRILYTAPLHLVSLQVLNKGASDHFPVMADFVMKST